MLVTLILAILVALLTVVVVLLGAAIWSLTHVKRGDWSQLESQDSRSDRFPELVAQLCLSSVREGNAVEVLQNGDGFFPALREAIARASQSVHFETFLWKSGELSASLVDALCERASAGVEVRMVIDGQGGLDMDDDERARLRGCGVDLRFFRPPTWRNIGTYNGRDHRKLAVIDSRVAFVGGHCVTDEWLGDAQDRDHYRDLSVRLEGPIVGEVQAAFAENWTEVTGEVLADERLFPAQPRAGDASAHLAYINVERRVSAVKTLYIMAISAARESILIQNPYFLPDDGSVLALKRAVERGVRVRIMTPTFESTDNRLVLHAMRRSLRPVLEAGIEVLGYHKTLLHQKVMTIDGHWSIVGSTNFDFRSFEINDEVSVSLFDEGLAETLEKIFEADVADCHRYTLADLEQVSLAGRLRDRLAFRIREQL